MSIWKSIRHVFRAAEAPAPQSGIHSLILPHAMDRWLTADTKTYTPEFVETLARGAMSGDLTARWQMFDLMEQTWPRLQKNLNEIKDAVVGLDWQIQPYNRRGERPTPEAARRADLIEDLIWEMEPDPCLDENDLPATIRDLLDARGKGIAVLEVDWHRRSVESGAALAPRATRWVHPRYYGWDAGASNSVDRLMLNVGEMTRSGRVRTQLDQRFTQFPEHKFVIGICKTKSGHPISGALLRTLGFWWAASNFTRGWFLNFAQIFGMPIRWANYDPNISTSDRTKLEEMLEAMGSSSWAMFPTGVQMELKEAAKTGTDNPQMALLEYADKVCDILVLRQTLTTDVADSGSRALGDVHQGVLTGVKQAMADWAASVLQRQFIRSICVLNFGDDRECPYLIPVLKADKDPLKTAQFLEVAHRIVDLPKAHTYQELGIPLPGPGDEIIPVSAGPVASPGAGMPVPGAPARNLHEADAEAVKAKGAPETAPAAIESLVTGAVASVAGVRPRWLAPVQAELDRLIAGVKSGQMSDQELRKFLESAARNLPDLFAQMDHRALGDALEDAMGKAVVTGLADKVGA